VVTFLSGHARYLHAASGRFSLGNVGCIALLLLCYMYRTFAQAGLLSMQPVACNVSLSEVII